MWLDLSIPRPVNSKTSGELGGSHISSSSSSSIRPSTTGNTSCPPALGLWPPPKVTCDIDFALVLGFTGVAATSVTPSSLTLCLTGASGAARFFDSTAFFSWLALGFGLKTRDMLTSRLSTRFLGAASPALCSRSRSSARDTDRDRERASGLDLELVVERAGEGCREEPAREGAFVGISGDAAREDAGEVCKEDVEPEENGEFGKILERKREHNFESCGLNLGVCT